MGHGLGGRHLQEEVHVVRHHLQSTHPLVLLPGDAFDQDAKASRDVFPRKPCAGTWAPKLYGRTTVHSCGYSCLTYVYLLGTPKGV